jgi:hypothetical protein
MSLLLLAQAASACSVCFNDDGSGIAQGLQYGIIVLLAATGAIVAALFYFVLKIEKDKTAAEEAA